MEPPKGSLTNQLQSLGEITRAFLSQGKQVLASMEQAKAENHLDKPLLLRITLEKCMELLEEKLVPVLPKQTAANPRPQEPVIAAAPDPGAETGPRIVESFRGSSPRPQAPAQTPQPSPVAAAPKRQVEDFRGTDPRLRPVARPATSAPAVAAAPAQEPTPAKSVHLIGPDPATRLKSPPGSRRTIPRFKCRLPLSYDSVAGSSGMQRAYTKDIGATGLFIMANRPEKKGQMIRIVVELPGHARADLQAVVQWTKWVPPNLRGVDQPGFGVKVTNATENWYQFFMNAT